MGGVFSLNGPHRDIAQGQPLHPDVHAVTLKVERPFKDLIHSKNRA